MFEALIRWFETLSSSSFAPCSLPRILGLKCRASAEESGLERCFFGNPTPNLYFVEMRIKEFAAYHHGTMSNTARAYMGMSRVVNSRFSLALYRRYRPRGYRKVCRFKTLGSDNSYVFQGWISDMYWLSGQNPP